MKISYLWPMDFFGKGIGRHSWAIAKPVFDANFLERIVCFSYRGGSGIDESKIVPVLGLSVLGKFLTTGMLHVLPKFWKDFNNSHGYHITYSIMDILAQNRIGHPDIVHSWPVCCNRTFSQAKRNGVITVLESPNSHIENMVGILQEEFSRYNINTHSNARLVDLTKESYELADYIKAPSNFVKDSFTNRGFSQNKISIVPYAVDFPIEEKRIGSGEGKFIVVFSGSVVLRKGFQYLLKAWKLLNLPDAELWFCGKIDKFEFGPVMKDVGDLPSSVKFLGYVDLRNYYPRADVCVIPTLEDGFCLSIAEAMACGLAIVTTRNAGVSDYILDGENGFIVPIRDAKAIADRIEYLYHNRDKLERVKSAAFYTAKNNFSIDKVGKGLLEFYNGIIQAKKNNILNG